MTKSDDKNENDNLNAAAEPLAVNQPQSNKNTKGRAPLYVAAIVIAVVSGSSGYVAGMAVGTKADSKQTAMPDGSRQGGGDMRMMGQRAGFGTVTAIASDSIVVSVQQGLPDQQSDSTQTTKTYTINSSTVISDGEDDASTTDIQVGDRVVVQTSTDDDTVAASITINPTMGGMGDPGQRNGQTQNYENPNTSDYDISNM